ncbi:hypothetical protein D6D25_09559, partial [Aureobasidium pullulans]
GGSGSDNFVLKREDESRGSVSWSNISPAQTGGSGSTPHSSVESRRSPPDVRMSDTTLTRSRHNSASTHPYERRSNVGLRSDFGNLPFSSAIKANGYPENIQQQQLKNLDATAEYSMLPLHTFESEALGRAYLSFRDATLQMIADGMNARDVLGTSDLINLDLYFRDRIPEDGHSVSTFVCEMMKSLANPDVFAKLASMVLLAPLLRWILFPTSEHYRRIPALMRPLPSQRFIPHSPALDLAPQYVLQHCLNSAIIH